MSTDRKPTRDTAELVTPGSLETSGRNCSKKARSAIRRVVLVCGKMYSYVKQPLCADARVKIADRDKAPDHQPCEHQQHHGKRHLTHNQSGAYASPAA